MSTVVWQTETPEGRSLLIATSRPLAQRARRQCRTIALVIPVGLIACAGEPQSVTEPHLFRQAVIVESESSGTSQTLTVRFDSTTERLVLMPPDVPTRFRALVEPAWSRPCRGSTGAQVRVARLGDQVLAVLENTAAAAGADALNDKWVVCFVRLYFDWSALPGADAHRVQRSAFTVLGLISRLSEMHTVWVRGPASDILRLYDGSSWMHDAAPRHGQPELAPSVPRLAALRTRLGAQTVLAEVLPFRFTLRDQPVGGGWPYFVLRLYADAPGGHQELANFSALARGRRRP
jgi:hypothetical protein